MYAGWRVERDAALAFPHLLHTERLHQAIYQQQVRLTHIPATVNINLCAQHIKDFKDQSV